jgi:acylphosphatase
VIAVRVVASGRVQGVGFRWHTRSEALRLGLTGWVCNRADGSVEVHLEGRDARVDEMLTWLGTGPPTARVDELAIADAAVEGFDGFAIRR